MALITCKECTRKYSDTLEACPHCGYKEVYKGVIIHGYPEAFAINPDVKVFKDGVVICKVQRNSIVKYRLCESCTLKFKSSLRTVECFVRPGDHVFLSLNRLTGALEASISDEQNAQAEMNKVNGKDSSRILWILIIICFSLLASVISLS